VITVGMLLEVIRYSLDKDILTEVTAEHTDYRTSFQIADMIENLVHFESVLHRDFNGVGGTE
jgi:hypothetical protein